MAARVQFIDAARTLAISSVVLCHATETIYSLSSAGMASLSAQSGLFALSSFTLGRLGVPFFLFMTGYLLLDRDYDAAACVKFWKGRWLPLLACVEVWIVVYDLYLAITVGGVTAETVARDMLFMQNVKLMHYWYLPMIVGVYLFVPVMGMALARLSPRVLAAPVAVIFVYCFVAPAANVALSAVGADPLQPKLDPGFSGGAYGIYLLAGWAVKRGGFDRVPPAAVLVTGVALVAATVVLQAWAYDVGSGYNVWYNNALLFAGALMLFAALSRVRRVPLYPTVRWAAHY